MAASAVYKADINIAFNDGEYTQIEKERIVYLMIEYRYENINILPIMYLSLKIPLDLHDRILDAYETAKFYITIDKKDYSCDTSLATNHIEGEFSYVCSNQEQNSAKLLNNDGTDDRSYVETLIGLVSSDLTNALRHSFNTIVPNEIDEEEEIYTKDLVKLALKDLDGTLVMTQLKYDIPLKDRFIIPPTTSRFRLLSKIFDLYPFYDTYFNFFLDFNNVLYLLDKTGEPVIADDYPDTIYINITQKEDYTSIFPGSSIRNGAQQIFVNAAQSITHANESINQMVNTLAAYDYDTGMQELTVSENFSGINKKMMYLKDNNAALYKNEIVNDTVLIELFKPAINAGIISPNRSYIISQEGNYSKYNGRYILTYKQEMYAQAGDGTFRQTCSCGFKRINEIEIANAKENTSMSVRHKVYNKTGLQKSSADYRGKYKSVNVSAADRRVSGKTK